MSHVYRQRDDNSIINLLMVQLSMKRGLWSIIRAKRGLISQADEEGGL
jgi:hypothetical protein